MCTHILRHYMKISDSSDTASNNNLYKVDMLVYLTSTTVGRINFEDKKFRGFRGYLLNLEIKYPRKFPA